MHRAGGGEGQFKTLDGNVDEENMEGVPNTQSSKDENVGNNNNNKYGGGNSKSSNSGGNSNEVVEKVLVAIVEEEEEEVTIMLHQPMWKLVVQVVLLVVHRI